MGNKTEKKCGIYERHFLYKKKVCRFEIIDGVLNMFLLHNKRLQISSEGTSTRVCGRSLTLASIDMFLVFGIIQFGPKTGLAPVKISNSFPRNVSTCLTLIHIFFSKGRVEETNGVVVYLSINPPKQHLHVHSILPPSKYGTNG